MDQLSKQLENLTYEVGNKIEEGDPTSDEVKENRKFYLDLHKTLIDYQKVENANEESDARMEDNEIKRQQLKDQKIDRWVRVGITTAELLIPLTIGVLIHGSNLKFSQSNILDDFARTSARWCDGLIFRSWRK